MLGQLMAKSKKEYQSIIDTYKLQGMHYLDATGKTKQVTMAKFRIDICAMWLEKFKGKKSSEKQDNDKAFNVTDYPKKEPTGVSTATASTVINKDTRRRIAASSWLTNTRRTRSVTTAKKRSLLSRLHQATYRSDPTHQEMVNPNMPRTMSAHENLPM